MGTKVAEVQFKRFVVALFLFFFFSSMTMNQPLLAASAITLLREPYVQIVKPTSLYIVWTTKESGTSEVHYGISDYGLTAVATNTYVTTPDKSPYDKYYVHEAFLSGLTPDTLYQYKIFTDSNDLTPAGSITFRSGKPSSVTSFRFAALGDSGAGGSGQIGVANRLEQIQPDLVVHTGDVVYDASYKLLEERFFQIYDDLIQSVWVATLPGNHDTAYNGGQSYVDVFINPTNGASDPIENESYYSFDYANAHFTVITSEWPYKKGTYQYNWLQNDLANSNAPWKFVMFHLPFYYTDQRQAFKTNGTATSDLVPLFEQYGVDVVLSGDVHLYERMVPIKGGKATSTDDGGILYVVTGGGGTGLSPAGNPPWNALTANKAAIFHNVMFDINDCQLSFSAIKGGTDSFDDSDIFDTFSINHCDGVPTADFSANVAGGDTPLAVSFADLSSGHPTGWSWDFGDGTTSTNRHPIHTYVNPGVYTVKLTASNSNGSDTKIRTSYITVSGDPTAQFAFNGGDQTVSESAGLATFSVKLSVAMPETVSVDYGVADQTAVHGEDYDMVSGTLVFAPGQTVQTFTVPIFDDLLDEAAETAVVSLLNPSSGMIISPDQVTLTITDNDEPPTVQFEADSFTTIENIITGTLTVTLSTPSGQPVSVKWSTSDGTATAGSDYDAVNNATVTIPAGGSFVRVDVPLINDVAEENGETVLATLSSPTNATLGEPKTTTLTIIDDDQPPTVQFASDSYTVDEGAGMAEIAVELLGYADETVAVTLTTGDETAVSGSDYTPITTTLTFAPGQISQTAQIPISDDALDETDETVALTLSDLSSNAFSGTPMAATLTITDNDEPPTIAFAATTLGGDEGTTATATVQLSGPSAKTVTVAYATSSGTATAGSDYTAASGTLTFAPGQTTATFGVALLDDALDEAAETVILTLSNPTNGTLGDPNPATLTIGDNDAPPTVQVVPTAVSVPENGGTAVVTVTLSVVSGQPVTVTYGTVGETAVSGTHFTPTSGTLTFAPGETSHTISVPVLDNSTMNGNKTFRVELSSPVNAALGADDAATVTIEDDELPLVSFAEAALTVAEDAGEAVLTVELDRAGVMPMTVDFVAEGETAVSGSDFTPTSGTLTFAPGETSQTFVLPLLDDTMDEESETVRLRLQNIAGGNVGTPIEAVVTLTDDDAPPTVSFASATFQADEDGGAAVVTLQLSAPSGKEVRVNVVTNGGTAVADLDYTPLIETVTFVPGTTSQTVSILLLPDDLSEGNETIHLALGGLQNGTAGEWLTAVVTIIDGDSSTLYLPIIFKR
ncbi:MAG: Calx-beta domain-containing protein [Chloroflexota bacterium]